MGFCVSHERANATLRLHSALNAEQEPAVVFDGETYADILKYYKLGRVIGHCSLGSIRIATCLRTLDAGTQVAVRSVSKSVVETNLQVLRQELALFRLLDHPNILRFYEIFEDDRFIHLVTEHCSGGSISERIASRGLFCESKVRDLFEKLIRAMLHMHKLGFCHRDLRPQNILYETSESVEVKIADFCDMTFIKMASSAPSFSSCPNFMAPEIFEGKVGKECDIWSLGAILFYLLSGEIPFDDDEPSAQFYRIVGAEFTFHNPNWNSVSSAAKDLINQMIVVMPSERLSLEDVLRHSWMTTRETDLRSTTIMIESLQHLKSGNKLQRELMRTVVKYLSPRTVKTLTVRTT